MSGVPFSFADCEAVFGPECAAIVERNVAEAPEFSPEQILAGRRIFASFLVLRSETRLVAPMALEDVGVDVGQPGFGSAPARDVEQPGVADDAMRLDGEDPSG